MVYMFNELSLSKLSSVSEVRTVLEKFVKCYIEAKSLGFSELRLHEYSLQNLYQLSLHDNYRIDSWLRDKEVNPDLRLRFQEIVSTFPLITQEEIIEKELYDRSDFHKEIENLFHQVFGLGAAYTYGTLAISLATHSEWENSTVSVNHYSIDFKGNEKNASVDVLHFSTINTLHTHNGWINAEKQQSLRKSVDLWNRRSEYFPNVLLGLDIENQLQKIGLAKKFFQIVDCLNKVNDFSKRWKTGGFNLNEFNELTKMMASGESECTMNKYYLLRRFRLHDGEKVQFEFHIKIPDVRIYFFPNEETHEITIGYIGPHLRTCLYD
ncbi:MAG: hypothetical protein M3R17_00220 [Bacteroidota bacterium]|nr:hypothetical protein [Bacteroidota bacterium]